MTRFLALALSLGVLCPAAAPAACCYFSAKNADILQPAQKVFTWDPQAQTETFTVQPKFEGNALDFGMVIPTPSQPKLHEMPRDFFKHLAVYSILKKREFPHSKLLPVRRLNQRLQRAAAGTKFGNEADNYGLATRKPAVVVRRFVPAWAGPSLYLWAECNDEACSVLVGRNFFCPRGHFGRGRRHREGRAEGLRAHAASVRIRGVH